MKRTVLIGFPTLLVGVAMAVLLIRPSHNAAPSDPAPAPPALAAGPGPRPSVRPAPPEIVLPELPGHDDLNLVPDPPGPFRVYPGMTPNVTFKLVNTSRTQSHPVVRPGDGSEAGWCEPYTFLTATLTRPGGETVELKREPYSRCGNYDPEWVKRVVVLKPGESIPIRGWCDLVPFDLQEEGTVAMRVHYRYAGRASHKEFAKAEPAAERGGGMQDVPPFEVVSEPFQVQVVRPFDLKLTLKRPTVKVGESFVLPELIGLELTRRGNEPLDQVLGEPCYAGTVHLFAKEVSDNRSLVIEGGFIGDPAWMQLPRLEPAAGERIDLLSLKRSLSDNFNRPWKGRSGVVLQIQVSYRPNEGRSAALFRSNTVELTITP